VEQSPSYGANKSSASQEILRILQTQGVRYLIYKGPPPVPVLTQIKLVPRPHPTA